MHCFRVARESDGLAAIEKRFGLDFLISRLGHAPALLFNRGSAPAKMTIRWTDVGINATPAHVRDLWAHRDVMTEGAEYSSVVPAHGVVMLRAGK